MATYNDVSAIKIGNDTFNLARGNPSDVNNIMTCVIIPNYAFSRSTIASISLPNVLYIGEKAF